MDEDSKRAFDEIARAWKAERLSEWEDSILIGPPSTAADKDFSTKVIGWVWHVKW